MLDSACGSVKLPVQLFSLLQESCLVLIILCGTTHLLLVWDRFIDGDSDPYLVVQVE